MSEFDDRINQLQHRLEALAKYQEDFHKEIVNIHFELKSLRAAVKSQAEVKTESPKPPVREYIPPPRTQAPQAEQQQTQQQFNEQADQQSGWYESQQTNTPNFEYSANSESSFNQTYAAEPKEKSDIEKFIGENLISKIGIVITVLGVAIGAKYAIDNDLISPLTRIILGYLFGFALLSIAVHLKEKYLNFSAVLLSGAMAIQYFITYAAYSFYNLISQKSAFALMLIFTVFTILSAIKYNRQVIAHFGLVGAYTIPFLLSDGSGNFAFLFSYISIINVGILAISVVKYWKPLYFSSFIITWATFSAWYADVFRAAEHFNLAIFFASVFFLIFYLTFLAYKAINKEPFTATIVFLVLANSFIFYGLGYAIIDSRAEGDQFLGLFTVANAALHFIIGFIISRYNLADKSSIHLITALVLTFITIAVPVQFQGSWLTLLWTAEAMILFWIGRTKAIALYEYFSYPLMGLAFVSLLNDWQPFTPSSLYENIETVKFPLYNEVFLTSILFVAAFGFIYFINKSEKYEPTIIEELRLLAGYVIPMVFLLALYNTFRLEIGNYWHYRIISSVITTGADTPPSFNYDLRFFNAAWQINYTLFFLTILSIVNIKKIRSEILGFVNLFLNALALLIFLVAGLFVLGVLRESYLQPTAGSLFIPTASHIFIRYISLAFVAALAFVSYQYIKEEFLYKNFPNLKLHLAFDFVFYSSLWIIASSELINWMDIFGYEDSYKLGLSILWGIYALFLVILGISQNKKYLRIGAMALFALTLAKVFFYDIAHLNTISKTVVFVSLGILLLIISFLYNKYKHLIIEPGEV
jgi:uncharacterized membrane protein